MAKSPATPYELTQHSWQIAESQGLSELIGPIWLRESDGDLLVGFFAEGKHLNPNKIIHGGVLAAFADHALGRISRHQSGGRKQATVQLGIHYIAAVHEGQFVELSGGASKQTKSLSFMRGQLSAEDQLVATAEGVWKFLS